MTDKTRLPIVLLGIVAGGMIYGGVSVIAGYFAPVTAVIAGFFGGSGLAIYDRRLDAGDTDVSVVALVLYCICGIIALIIGYYIIYNFAEIPISMLGNVRLIHPNNPSMYPSFPGFMAATISIPTIICIILGSTLCAAGMKRLVHALARTRE
ncbi:MAG: hypothetical protein EF813_04975 [Methanosarcinales archaeon]|nr:MAG: hypothetical protein EF813_04975 [Methanosarcinales archaeon]